MSSLKVQLYVVQLAQCIWWFCYLYLIDSDSTLQIQLRISVILVAFFRSLEIILNIYFYTEKQIKYLLRFCHLVGNLGLTELIMNDDSLFIWNKPVNVIFLLNNINSNQETNQKYNQIHLALIVCYMLIRNVVQMFLQDDKFVLIEPLLCLIGIQYVLVKKLKRDEVKEKSNKSMNQSQQGYSQQKSKNMTVSSANCLQRLINIFPQGIIMINAQRQVEFMNIRCFKLLEVDSQQKVMQLINHAYQQDKLSHNNLSYMEDDDDLSFLEQFFKEQVNYPLHKDEDAANSDATLQFAYKLNYEFRSAVNDKIRKFRIKIVSSYANNSLNNSQINAGNKDLVLFILIKNVSKQQQLKKLEQEFFFQNSLLKSFSHELRTPLNCSIQMLGIARDKTNNDELIYLIDIAASQNFLLIYQINDILDFAAFQSNQFQYQWKSFKFKDIKSDIEQLYTYQCQSKKIDLKIECQKKFLDQEIVSDKQRIMQVLVNLLNNSLKFTKSNGKITLKIEPDSHQTFQFTVIDNGSGIDQVKLEKFSQQNIEEPKFMQFGLGINISAKIVYGLGSKTLEIQSQQGKGTKISFNVQNKLLSTGTELDQINAPIFIGSDLPIQYINNQNNQSDVEIVDSQSENTNKKCPFESSIVIQDSHQECNTKMLPKFFNSHALQDYMQANNCQCCQILVVDDVPSNQLALKNLFKKFQYRVDQAYDGEDALKKVKEKLECCDTRYQLIMMDVEMPNMDGFQATTEILKLYQTNIIMCSAYDSKEIIEQAMQCGMCEVLIKPIQIKDVKRLIKKYMNYQ